MLKTQSIFQKTTTDQVMEALHFVKRFCGQTVMIKVGGAPLQKPEVVQTLCEDLSLLRAAGISIVLVHGGGAAVSEALAEKNFPAEFHEGMRVTSEEMIGTVESTLCGAVNGALVRNLNAHGVKAVGLSGASASTFQCERWGQDYGEVGKIQSVDPSLITSLLESQKESNAGYIPVVSSIGADAEGKALNINADWACVELAAALKIQKVIYMTDADGLLNGEGHLISEIDASGLNALIEEKVIVGGMLAKVRTILQAFEAGVEQVHIISGSRPHALIEEVFTKVGIGTVCKKTWESENA